MIKLALQFLLGIVFFHASTSSALSCKGLLLRSDYHVIWVEDSSPPLPSRSLEIDEAVAKQLLDSTKPEHRKAFSFMLEEIRKARISFADFRSNLEAATKSFLQSNPKIAASGAFVNFSIFEEIPSFLRNSKSTHLTKSNFWTLQLLMERKTSLGLPNRLPVFSDLTSLSEYISRTRTKDIIITDDASFSGSQIIDILDSLSRDGRFSEITVHIIIPYMTETALKRINDFTTNETQQRLENVRVYTQTRIKNVQTYTRQLIPSFQKVVADAVQSNQLSAHDQKILEDNFYYEGGEVLTYFDHKIPDFLSAVSSRMESADSEFAQHIVENMTIPTNRGEHSPFTLITPALSPYKLPTEW